MKIFVSSTYRDLVNHRAAVNEILLRMKAQLSAMEYFGSHGDTPSAICYDEISECDILIGIYAWRYGWRPKPYESSITEQEFDYARSKGKTCLCYVIDDNFPWLPTLIDDGEAASSLANFKNKVGNLVCSRFTTPDDLAKQVAADLAKIASLANDAETTDLIEIPSPMVSLRSANYVSSVEIDEDCMNNVLIATEPVEIKYSSDVSYVITLIDNYDRDPTPLLKKIPYMRTNLHEPRKRELAAATYHAQIHEINLLIKNVTGENRNDLNDFVRRLRNDKITDDIARRALGNFGWFAALRLIKVLKRAYDVQDDKAVLFFENYAFNEDPSYCYLDWVPRKSPTGKRIFGYNYYVGAMVRRNKSDYEYVMLPLDLARRLRRDGRRGDEEVFYTWVLPQLYTVGCHYGIDKFSADSWEVFILQGADGEAYSINDDPWKNCRG
jgi:hypothetical protein